MAAYARHRGCDEKAVRKAVAEGRITPIERDGKRLIDPEVADIQWARNTRARASGSAKPAAADAASRPASTPTAPAGAAGGFGGFGGDDAEVGDGIDYQEAARRLKVEEARIARMERLERERKLTDAEAVGRAIWTAFRTLRDAAMPLGRRVAGRVAPMTDPREIQLLIDEEMRLVLQSFRARILAPVLATHAPTVADDGDSAAPAAQA